MDHRREIQPMTSMHRFLIAAAAAAAVSLPASSFAEMECKPDRVAALTPSVDSADSYWTVAARQKYGLQWANWHHAKDKEITSYGGGVPWQPYTVYATPCRVLGKSYVAPVGKILLKTVPPDVIK
jgi:hypothetical protein